MIRKLLNFTFKLILLFTSYYFLGFDNNTSFSQIIKLVLLILSFILFVACIFVSPSKYSLVSRLLSVIYTIYIIVIVGYIILDKLNILKNLTSVTSLKEYILYTGSSGVLTYILIQAGQVVFLPIPAAIICIVGSLIYGPLLGGIYCSIGVLLGSCISFAIGKTFGIRIVNWIVGKENTKKYTDIIKKRGGFFLCLAFLLPMFPDDILCLIAGITNIKFKTFFICALITRPIGVLAMSFFGGGYLIPFSGWGLYVWGVILIGSIFAVVLIYKYQEVMQDYIMCKIFKNKINRNI